MYGSYVLPGPVILLVLGLLLEMCRADTVNDGSADVLILCWGQEQYLLGLDLATVTPLALWGAVKVLLLTPLLHQQEVLDMLHVDTGQRLARVL